MIVAAQPFIWNGFYIGGNLGYGISEDPTTMTTTAGPGAIVVPAGTGIYGSPQTFNLGSRGWNGGGQIGYNLQFTPNWVVGFETDIQGADQRYRQNCIVPCGTNVALAPGIIPAIFPVHFSDNSVEHRLRWFGTVRGRLGYAVGSALWYVTGGLAYAEIERSGSVAGTTSILGLVTINSFSGAFNTSNIRTGGTVGAGIEAQLGGGFSVKSEYLYMDFGRTTDTFNTVINAGVGAGLVGATRTIDTETREHVFRIGVNYAFSGVAAASFLRK